MMKVTETLVAVEDKIDRILRDKLIINMLSKNVNTAIKLQSFLNNRLEVILKIADVATLKSLNDLFASINHLEKESIKQAERIAELEKLLLAAERKPAKRPSKMTMV